MNYLIEIKIIVIFLLKTLIKSKIIKNGCMDDFIILCIFMSSNIYNDGNRINR